MLRRERAIQAGGHPLFTPFSFENEAFILCVTIGLITALAVILARTVAPCGAADADQ